MKLTKDKLTLTRSEAKTLIERLNAISNYLLDTQIDITHNDEQGFRKHYSQALHVADVFDTGYTFPLMDKLGVKNEK